MTQDQTDPYSPLRRVLDEAFEQASGGKGKERHAQGRPFLRQPILEIGRMVGPGFEVGQAMKKGQEALGFLKNNAEDAQRRACTELLGAINYLAAAVILIREQKPDAPASQRQYKLLSEELTPEHIRRAIERVKSFNKELSPEESITVTPDEHLICRALTQDDVTRHVQLRDGRRAAVVAWESHNEPYAFRLREILLTSEPRREEQELPMVNMFGDSEAGHWHPTDVYGVWMPKEQRLYGEESGRANIGHSGELGSRFLCEEDVGKYAFRRDGQTVHIAVQDGGKFKVLRPDSESYWVNKSGFLRDPGLPNDADIRQVLK